MRGLKGRGIAVLLVFAGGAPMFATACSAGEGDVRAASGTERETQLHLESWFGSGTSLLAEASYKVKSSKGTQSKELKVELENAKPGVRHKLTLDGFELGTLTTDLDGEAEYEASALPGGCPEPKAGSVLRVGELLTMELAPLQRVVDLETPISGPGSLSGKVVFRVNRLGAAETTELQVKVSGAPANSVHPVKLGGSLVANLEVEDDGKGKLELSNRRGDPLPAAFVAPTDGTQVDVGTLFSGALVAQAGG